MSFLGLSTLNIDDLDWSWTLKIRVFSDFLAIFDCKRVNCDKMDGDRPKLPANRNCYRLLRMSWALAQTSYYTNCNLSFLRWLYAGSLRKHLNVVWLIVFLQKQETLPDWKDRHDMLSALRACSYNPHQCIATYLDWGDTSMLGRLFVILLSEIINNGKSSSDQSILVKSKITDQCCLVVNHK